MTKEKRPEAASSEGEAAPCGAQGDAAPCGALDPTSTPGGALPPPPTSTPKTTEPTAKGDPLGASPLQLKTALTGAASAMTGAATVAAHRAAAMKSSAVTMAEKTLKEAGVRSSLYSSFAADGDTRASLRAWLPRGKDLYAIAVQECMCWDELRLGVLQSLNEDSDSTSEPPPYVLLAFTSIGTKRIKGHIGIAVYARRRDVESGYVALGDERAPQDARDRFDDCASAERAAAHVPLGTNLGVVGRSANKGSSGVRVRVGDAHLAFLGAHLPADASGHARRELRNACAGASLKSAGEQLGFMVDGGFTYAGVHLAAATHTFFLGDLNYRAVPPSLKHARETTIGRVADALTIEANGADSTHAWSQATRDDELLREMLSGRVFANFEELPLRFAPTFRRKMGPAGVLARGDVDASSLCDSYTLFKDERKANKDGSKGDPVTIETALAKAQARIASHPPKGFSPEAVAEAAAAAAAIAGLRAPSWTDRVLVHSLPRARDALLLEAYDSVELPGNTDHHPVRLVSTLRQRADRGKLYDDAKNDRADRLDVTISLEALRVENLGLENSFTFDRLLDDLTSDGTPTFCTSDTPVATSDTPVFSAQSARSTPFKTADSVKHLESDGGEYSIDRVSLFFPLPVEDVDAAERFHANLTAALQQDNLFEQENQTAFAARKKADGHAARAPWADRAVSCRAEYVPATVNKDGDKSDLDFTLFPRHCLVGVDTNEEHKETGFRCIAFALVELPDGPAPASREFRVPLSLSGHARGVLAGKISISKPRLAKPRSRSVQQIATHTSKSSRFLLPAQIPENHSN